jgi:hypothetical protein
MNQTSVFLLSVLGEVREPREASEGWWGVKNGKLHLTEEHDGSVSKLSTALIVPTAAGIRLDGRHWDREAPPAEDEEPEPGSER